jgi:hypothetical protein
MPRYPVFDPTFLDESMDTIREMVDDAIKSRRKVFEETYTMTAFGRRVETVTITVRRERPA